MGAHEKWHIGVLALAVLGCGGQGPSVPATPAPTASDRIEPLSPPAVNLPVPVPEDEWVPIYYDTGEGAALIAALGAAERLALILPRKGDPTALESRVFRMVTAASPGTRIVARSTADLDALIGDGAIPGRLTGGAGDATTRHAPRQHPLPSEWLSGRRAMKGADAVLVVRPVEPDIAQLEQLKAATSGGCEGFLSAMSAGMDSARDASRGFAEQASSLLAEAFSRQLETALPFWRDELSGAAEVAERGSAKARCAGAYGRLLDEAAPCVDGACALGPALYTIEGGIIGAPDPSPRVPEACPVPGMRDYAAEIVSLADRAVAEVLPALDRGWAAELMRLDGMTQAAALVSERCAPRHRRIDRGALGEAREAVRGFLGSLAERELTSRWISLGGMARVPDIGPVRILARAEPPPDLAAALQSIERPLREVDRCAAQAGRVFQATVLDVERSLVTFMGLFFEEQLLCGDLPPL